MNLINSPFIQGEKSVVPCREGNQIPRLDQSGLLKVGELDKVVSQIKGTFLLLNLNRYMLIIFRFDCDSLVLSGQV
jgi:hypothetical protein